MMAKWQNWPKQAAQTRHVVRNAPLAKDQAEGLLLLFNHFTAHKQRGFAKSNCTR